ncbi:MAG: glycosyltransferase [Lamprobacter sp.]|uniref:glycosyltransferase n=1 Tax=Lamprobacter sp. TaxID=3100796 RepID=UPI002B257B71|nr:glycosyltransferase [Lamprobacter sp.]MEA3639820.1 glycosyltransferase [Lamprobacter sp.]
MKKFESSVKKYKFDITMNLCVLTHLFPARSETFVREHVLGMARRGHQVTVIARSMDADIQQQELQKLDEFKITRIYIEQSQSITDELVRALRALLESPNRFRLLLKTNPWSRRSLLLALDIAKKVDALKPDLIHVHFGTLAARLERIRPFVRFLPPMLVTWHGYDANAMPRSLGEDVYHDLFATEAIHTVGSQFMRRRLLALGAREDQISINPMGIDLTRFAYRERPANSQDQPLKVLSVGRLDEMKGHRYLIEAFAHLKQRGVLSRLRIIGEGPLRSMLEKQIDDFGLMNSVKLLGSASSNQVIEEMYHADLFTLSGVEAKTGKVETQGVVFAEAQATGLPVVACDVGGVSDSLINGKTGILCAPKNVIALADAIEYFARNRFQINAFGKRGRFFVEDRFSLETMITKFEQLYR